MTSDPPSNPWNFTPMVPLDTRISDVRLPDNPPTEDPLFGKLRSFLVRFNDAMEDEELDKDGELFRMRKEARKLIGKIVAYDMTTGAEIKRGSLSLQVNLMQAQIEQQKMKVQTKVEQQKMEVQLEMARLEIERQKAGAINYASKRPLRWLTGAFS